MKCSLERFTCVLNSKMKVFKGLVEAFESQLIFFCFFVFFWEA
jgi:hypothetical protein